MDQAQREGDLCAFCTRRIIHHENRWLESQSVITFICKQFGCKFEEFKMNWHGTASTMPPNGIVRLPQCQECSNVMFDLERADDMFNSIKNFQNKTFESLRKIVVRAENADAGLGRLRDASLFPSKTKQLREMIMNSPQIHFDDGDTEGNEIVWVAGPPLKVHIKNVKEALKRAFGPNGHFTHRFYPQSGMFFPIDIEFGPAGRPFMIDDLRIPGYSRRRSSPPGTPLRREPRALGNGNELLGTPNLGINSTQHPGIPQAPLPLYGPTTAHVNVGNQVGPAESQYNGSVQFQEPRQQIPPAMLHPLNRTAYGPPSTFQNPSVMEPTESGSESDVDIKPDVDGIGVVHEYCFGPLSLQQNETVATRTNGVAPSTSFHVSPNQNPEYQMDNQRYGIESSPEFNGSLTEQPGKRIRKR